MNPMSPKVATAASHAAASSRSAKSSAAAAAGSVPLAPSPGPRSSKSSSSSRRAVRSNHEPRRTISKSPSPKPPGTTPTPPSRIVYGPGTIDRLPNELGRLLLTSPLIVVSPSRMAIARRIQALIPNLTTNILDSAVVNVRAQLVDDAVERVKDRDCVISVGGASAVGLARAVSILIVPGLFRAAL